MTSASELFYTRRSRYGRHESGSELGLEERSFRRTRREINGCDPPIRRRSSGAAANLTHQQLQPHRPVNYSERDTARVDEGSGHSSSGSSRINLSNFGVVANRGGRRSGNDRLPGAVLLARERLLERLRGVSLSGSRRSNRSSLLSHGHRLTDGDDYGPIDPPGPFWDTETLRESLSRDLQFADLSFQTNLLSQPTITKRRPPGLSENAIAHLQIEMFTKFSNTNNVRVSQECSICLENFVEGDELIHLSCAHRFHYVCLEPWIRTCGDCPYCRREIDVCCD